MKKGYSLDQKTVQQIEAMATQSHRDYSAIIEMAIDLLARQPEFETSPKRTTNRIKAQPQEAAS